MHSVIISVLAIIATLFVLFPTQGRGAPVSANTPADFEVDPKLAFCSDEKFQAAFKGPDGKQYFFRVHQVFVVNKNNVRSFPRDKIFPHSPYFVDAMAYSHQTGKAYLFKGRKVWIYQWRANEFTYLKKKTLKRPSPHIPDAAFFYQGFIYLLKNGFLYGWDERSENVIQNQIFSISYFWDDVPKEVDAVMQARDDLETLFWKWEGEEKDTMQYYLFDNASKKRKETGTFASYFPFC